MPTKCYTCQQEITFDKNIKSKTGKQIPLTPDKLYTHGHDKDGSPLNQPLTPEQQQQQQQTQQWGQKTNIVAKPSDLSDTKKIVSSGASQGGSFLDTKRIRVMLEEITQRQIKLEEKIESLTLIDTNKLIGQMQTIHDVIAPLLKTQVKVASELYEEKKDPALINHAQKAEKFQEAFQNRRKVDNVVKEDKDEPDLDESIPDSKDFEYLKDEEDENEEEGVIDEE